MKVLIGTDGSDEAIAAANDALALLATPDAVLLLVVVEPPVLATAGMESGFAGGLATPDAIDTAWAAVNKDAEAALDRTLGALSIDAPIEQVIAQGDPGSVICQLADEQDVDVVVVGSRGQGAIRRALLGSVSTHVVHHAPCPVMVIRESTDHN